jgi:tetraacyldisaccharide 4'-kinase
VLLAERLPGVPVVVGENRYDAGAVAVGTCLADSLVLDDGFQHKTLRKDLEIVVVSGRDPWGSGRLFPRPCGSRSALKRAGLVVVANPLTTAGDVARTLRQGINSDGLKRHRPTSSARRPRSCRSAEDSAGRSHAGENRGTRGFIETAEGLGAEVAGLAEFPTITGTRR